MVEAIQRLFESAASLPRWSWSRTVNRQAKVVEEAPKVGKFYADYSEVPRAQLEKTDAAMDDLLKRSKVISVKRGL